MASNHNFEHKYANAQDICIPVRDNAATWAEHTENNSTIAQNPNCFTVVPFTSIHPLYTQTFQQYFNQFASYLNSQMANKQFPVSEMELEKYINYEVNKQKTMMSKPSAKTPVRPPLAPHQMLKSTPHLPIVRNTVAKPKSKERRIINVEVVAMAGGARDTGKPSDVEPLPAVTPEFKEQVAKIGRSQDHYTQLLDRLSTILQTINNRYVCSALEKKALPVNDDAPPPPLKRARNSMSSSSSDSHLDVENNSQKDLAHYPMRVSLSNGNFEYMLGPNGTTITAKQYGEVFWTSAAIATRCLLAAVFTCDELATHTLTGKPSPAFYGRERPAKKMLDARRVDDIVVSVRNRTGGKERHIRGTITTKCADTAKKFKRRAKKANQDITIVIDD